MMFKLELIAVLMLVKCIRVGAIRQFALWPVLHQIDNCYKGYCDLWAKVPNFKQDDREICPLIATIPLKAKVDSIAIGCSGYPLVSLSKTQQSNG